MSTMEKVAILARVSTQGQDYERQVVELTDYCQRMNWEVVKVFANKVSRATRNAEREEISGLVEYVKEHRLNRIVCLEISRLGRNTLAALPGVVAINGEGRRLAVLGGVFLQVSAFNRGTCSSGPCFTASMPILQGGL